MTTEVNKQYRLVDEDFRSLVSVVKIDDIVPHTNADSLELAIVGGWQICVKKGEFLKGDLAIYCEIDSMLPLSNPAFTFLGERKDSVMHFAEGAYARVRTIKLRGELSQGLLLPVGGAKGIPAAVSNLTKLMGVKKLDPIERGSDEGLDGKIAARPGFFGKVMRWIAGPPLPNRHKAMPPHITRSDQKRIQSISEQYAIAAEESEDFEVTYKLDGASMTVYSVVENGALKQGICNRNNEIVLEDFHLTTYLAMRRWLAIFVFSNLSILRRIRFVFNEQMTALRAKETTVWPALKKLLGAVAFIVPKLERALRADKEAHVACARRDKIMERLTVYHEHTGDNIAVQGELIGPGINGNRENVKEYQFYVYSVFINGVQKLPMEAKAIVAQLDLNYIPVHAPALVLPEDPKECLKLADGKAIFDKSRPREGLVFKSNHRNFSFKVISNKYLLKNGD